MTTQIPLREGLFQESQEGPTLLAGRCTNCGHASYPTSQRCPNCGGEGHQIIELGGVGELHSGTVVHMGSQHFGPGYAVGYVNMPHGIRIFSQLGVIGCDIPAPGTTMQLEILPLWREDDHDVLAYRFVPTTRKENPDA